MLKPEDDYDALKDFLHDYEGTRYKSTLEEMRLEYNKLVKTIPDLEKHLDALPGRVFSGKHHPSSDARAVFFCYALPAPRDIKSDQSADVQWSEDAGYTQWYLYDLVKNAVIEGPDEIVDVIRSGPDTPRFCSVPQVTLADIRKEVEKYIKNTYLKKLQAPVGVKASLKAWMELS